MLSVVTLQDLTLAPVKLDILGMAKLAVVRQYRHKFQKYFCSQLD